jgi:hypothetical protein
MMMSLWFAELSTNQLKHKGLWWKDEKIGHSNIEGIKEKILLVLSSPYAGPCWKSEDIWWNTKVILVARCAKGRSAVLQECDSVVHTPTRTVVLCQPLPLARKQWV